MVSETEKVQGAEAGVAEKKEPAGIEIEAGAGKKARKAAEGPYAALLERLAEQIGGQAGARAVFGDPVERDGLTIVPVAQSIWGTGAGTGESETEGRGSGGGGGAMTRPVGYIEVSSQGAAFVALQKPWQDWRLVLVWAVSIWLLSRAVNRILRG